MRFQDVSVEAGIQRASEPDNKYRGPAVADLDGDGHPDLIFTLHHKKRPQLYFNTGKGTFVQKNWGKIRDTHTFTPFRHDPSDPSLRFALVRGGPNSHPLLFHVSPEREVTGITQLAGVTNARGRGRNAVFVSLRVNETKHPDVIFSNSKSDTLPYDVPMKGLPNGSFERVNASSLYEQKYWNMAAIDVDGDNKMEIVTMHKLCILRVVADFELKDVTRPLIPNSVPLYGATAIAELDFDNDGRMDLFIARSARSDLEFVGRNKRRSFQDFLLRGTPDGYVDVTAEKGIPLYDDSRGVTVADFDNNGWTDILVLRFNRPDVLLLNFGPGRPFRAVRPWMRNPVRAAGDMATAVDYDRDGMVDAIVSEGDKNKEARRGFYRIMRNVWPLAARRNYLHVRVGSSPRGTASSMYALVVVALRSGRRLTRRVGSQGSAGSISFVETLHFGLGRIVTVRFVQVKWIDGATEKQVKVRAKALLEFGTIPGRRSEDDDE